MRHPNRGFTLVELLISVVILLSVITAVSMIYRGAFISSEKATKHVMFATAMPGILDTVRKDIRDMPFNKNTLSGSGINGRVAFTWQAKMVTQKEYALLAGSSEFNAMLGGTNEYKLWQVDLNLESNGLNRHYQLKEVSWRDR